MREMTVNRTQEPSDRAWCYQTTEEVQVLKVGNQKKGGGAGERVAYNQDCGRADLELSLYDHGKERLRESGGQGHLR